MNRIVSFLLCFSLFTAYSFAQNEPTFQPKPLRGWYDINPASLVNPKTMFSDYPESFGLEPEDEMRIDEVRNDDLGFQHIRYQQYFRGIPVEGAECWVHAKDQLAIKANGFIEQRISVNTIPGIDAATALQKALEYIDANVYAWDDPGMELRLKEISANPTASFYPVPELMIADSDFNPNEIQGYKLVWKVLVYAVQPEIRRWVYVDAHTGTIQKEQEGLYQCNYHGVAETRYYGTRDIITDSAAMGYRLRDCTRGGGIETYDLNRGTNINNAVDFWDDDNFWDNANPQLDDVATDAHWSAEMTYDYFLAVHNRDSYDDKGSPLFSYVHYDQNLINASWNGYWAAFGDGSNAPLTTLDIVGHEFTHGFTWNAARLIYHSESGALNESFSDIFGNAIEHWADSSIAGWENGEANNQPIRSMSNPNQFNDPDTYKGNFWWTDPGDWFGVHTNSGVNNYWFYLVSDGGSGVNDNGDAFTVQGVGIQAAEKIAYRSLTTYLVSLSQFADAREASIQSAVDLYGFCSPEYIATVNAWHACGVGEPVQSDDFGVIAVDAFADCGLGNEEEITVTLQYKGCSPVSNVNMQLAYFIDQPFAAVVEPFTISDTLYGGETLTYTFNTKADFSGTGDHVLVARTVYGNDPYQANDSSDFIVVRNQHGFVNESVTFESFANDQSVLDSIYIINRQFGHAEILPDSGNNGSYGILMEGGDPEFSIFTLNGPTDVFVTNQEYSSFACLCIDATELEDLYLDFDLSMRESTWEADFFGQGRHAAAAMRVLVDGVEVERYEPDTSLFYPWTTHSIHLNDYIGEKITVCFEGKTILNLEEDPDDIGDRVLIDNINVNGINWATDLEESLAQNFTLYPNPAQDKVFLDLGDIQGLVQIVVFGLDGKRLLDEEEYASGQAMNVAGLGAGVYLLQVYADDQVLTKKLIIR